MIRVPGVGPKDCKVCFILEAPGEQEVRSRAPLVGRAGNLYNQLMTQVGLNRYECYITNVIKERPPDNDISVFLKIHKDGSVTETPAYRDYVEELRAELSDVSAQVFVPMGNTSLYALTGRTRITKWRGSILSTNIARRTVKVIPTLHPASALYKHINIYPILHDLERIKEESVGDVVRERKTYHTKPSMKHMIGYINRCHLLGKAGFDIEVMNEEMSCFALAPTGNDSMCCPLLSQGQDYLTSDDEVRLMHNLAIILENPNIEIVGQNLIFDATFMFHKYGIRINNIQDTMIAHAILYPDLPKGLDFITSTYTREPYYKDEGKKWFKFGGSEEDFWLYNAKDAAVCMEAFPKMRRDLERGGNWRTYERQRDLVFPLMYMQERGIRIDVEALQAESKDAGEKIETLTAELQAAAKKPLNPNSPKQLAAFFYIEKGFPPYTSRTSGSVTTNVDAMKRLKRKGSKEAALVLEIRKLSKLKGTYLDMELDDD